MTQRSGLGRGEAGFVEGRGWPPQQGGGVVVGTLTNEVQREEEKA